MLTTSSMELVSIAVFKDKVDEVVSHLIQLGIFHPVDVRNIEDELRKLSPLQIEKEYSEWEELDARIKSISRKLDITFEAQKDIERLSCLEIKKKIDGFEEKLTPLFEKKEETIESIRTKEVIISQLKGYLQSPVKRGSLYTFLDATVGKVEEKSLGALENSLSDIPHLVYPFHKDGRFTNTLVLGLKRDSALIEKVLKDFAWEKTEYPDEPEHLSHDAEEKMRAQIDEYKKDLTSINEEIRRLGLGYKKDLSQMKSCVSLKKTLATAKKYSCATEKTALLSGWVPLEEKERVLKEVKKVSESSYIEAKSPEETNISKEDIPVRLKHSTFIKPFELLIESYGIPRYGSIDPTIFVAITFLIMFGAMFGDFGQGLVLCTLGLFLLRSKNETAKQAASLLIYCGTSSAFFGLLYGSNFGYEFESIWFKPINSISRIFAVCVVFGIAVISVGIIINMINAFRDKNYLKALFDKAGLIGGIVYWAAIGLLSKIFVSHEYISRILVILISLGILLLFLKPSLEYFMHKSHDGIMVSFMEGIVDVVEIVMGYLANTVSFIRIAAFSLAHAGLFLAIFELSRILKNVGGDFLAILMIILGNILIIVLEGMVVTIQSLRLNYYEFFSKFFMTGKNTYKPLSIK